MIEREFIKEKRKYLKIKEFLAGRIPRMAGVGQITVEKTPLGEKVTIAAVRPSVVIGRAGSTITDLTSTIKAKFGLENPQLEVKEIAVPQLSATVMANKIADELVRFGTAKFKAIGYKTLQSILNAGALGAEIKISGRGVPGSRSKHWRFAAGYMKKCGQIALEEVDHAITAANLHTGTVGVQVKIMPPTIILPDRIRLKPQTAVTGQSEAKQ
jgi:small subunit ribosomal protein S3